MTSSLLDGIARAVLVILLNGLWQGAVIAAITWGALRLSPRVNASTRYAAWTLALVATLVVPVVTSLTHISYQPVSRHTAPVRAATNVKEPLTAAPVKPTAAEKSNAAVAPHLSLLHAPAVTVAPPALLTTALFALWALAAAALAFRLAVALLQLERLKRDALPLGMEYRERLQQWQANTGVDRDVRICVTEGIEVPVAVGLFDAMVLLPQHLLDTLDANEIDQISLHELAHLLRHDDWSNSFQRVVSALLFFNPAVWFIARQMDIEREVACDDYVLVLTGAVRNYAYCLTKMAEMTSWPHSPLAAPGVFITRKNISIRIERLLRTGRAISSSISPATASAVIAGLVAVFLVARVVTPVVAFALPAAAVTVSLSKGAVEPTFGPHERASTRTVRDKHEHAPKPAPTGTETPLPQREQQQPRFFPSPAAVAQVIPATRSTRSRGKVVAFTPGCTGCDFSHANLAGKDFRNQTLTGSDFENANLEGARFDNSDLSGANFSNANLRNASFVNANMTGCDLEDANLNGARFDGARLTGCQVDVRKLEPSQTRFFLSRCTGCDFTGANLAGLDLHGVKIVGIDLSGASLRGTNLSGAEFSGVDFSNADFTGANLNGTSFTGCDFSRADLRNVDLTHASFVGSSLGDARMKP